MALFGGGFGKFLNFLRDLLNKGKEAGVFKQKNKPKF